MELFDGMILTGRQAREAIKAYGGVCFWQQGGDFWHEVDLGLAEKVGDTIGDNERCVVDIDPGGHRDFVDESPSRARVSLVFEDTDNFPAALLTLKEGCVRFDHMQGVYHAFASR